MTLAKTEAQRCQTSIYLVSYDSFVADPPKQLASLLEFLNEPYQHDIFDKESNNTDGYTKDPKLFQAIQASSKTWTDYVSPQDARFLETALADIMRTFEYESVTAPYTTT
jgi:hypothetical protein